MKRTAKLTVAALTLVLIAAPVVSAQDRQAKGAVGAGLLTGGATLIGTPILGFFAGCFQIGYGAGMIVKAVASTRAPDPAFTTPVAATPLTITPLANSSGEPAAIADPANAAVSHIAVFMSNMRALGVAQNRYVSALNNGNALAAQQQLSSSVNFFNQSQQALFNTSTDLAQLVAGLDSTGNADGPLNFNVNTLYSSERTDLINNGFPASEATFLSEYQVTTAEQNGFITKLTGLSGTDAVGMYGSTITFRNLLGQLSLNSADIGANLATEVNFVPEPTMGLSLAVLLLAGLQRTSRKISC